MSWDIVLSTPKKYYTSKYLPDEASKSLRVLCNWSLTHTGNCRTSSMYCVVMI